VLATTKQIGAMMLARRNVKGIGYLPKWAETPKTSLWGLLKNYAGVMRGGNVREITCRIAVLSGRHHTWSVSVGRLRSRNEIDYDCPRWWPLD